MGISLKIKIPIGSRRRPSEKPDVQKPSGEGSSHKQAQDHRSRDPPSPHHSRKPESRPKPYIVQPTTRSYNIAEVRLSTAPQKPHVTTHTITTTTPSSRRHRRHSSISIRSPPRSSHGYVETRRRRSSQTTTPRSPVSPLGTSRFEYPSPWSRPQPAIQRDEYGFSIRMPSTPAGQANEYGMSALAPVDSDEYSYFEPWVGDEKEGAKEDEKEKEKSGWTEDNLRGYYSYGVGSVGAAGGRSEQSVRESQGRGAG